MPGRDTASRARPAAPRSQTCARCHDNKNSPKFNLRGGFWRFSELITHPSVRKKHAKKGAGEPPKKK